MMQIRSREPVDSTIMVLESVLNRYMPISIIYYRNTDKSV